jgi:hypothetical protein
MTARELAALVLHVLDAQQKYFKTRAKDDLIASARLEKELRTAAQAILAEGEEHF